jgi:integron integrase
MADLSEFERYLASRKIVPEKRLPFYLHWVSSFLAFCDKSSSPPDASQVEPFLHLLAKTKEEWQVKQAREAVRVFLFFLARPDEQTPEPVGHGPQTDWQRTAERVREALRLRHRSIRTEKTYLQWLRSFYLFLNGKKPADIEPHDVSRFLSHLALERKVAASTQNQAFNALLFLFRHVLDRELTGLSETVHAQTRRRLPVVLKRQEIHRIFSHLGGTHLLMARLVYGCGLRVQECVSLRVKDIDFEQSALTVRSGKGDKDRITVLPDSLKNDLQAHLLEVKEIFNRDVGRNDAAGVWLPNALARKYPNAGKEWGWFWVFPAATFSNDPRSDQRRRHHVDVSVLQRQFKKAVREAGIVANATVHSLRHSFATHLLEKDPGSHQPPGRLKGPRRGLSFYLSGMDA